MDNDILSEVIEAEKEIQRCLEAERARTSEWLGKVKKESEEEIARSEQEIRESLRASFESAQAEAHSKAASIVKEAETKAERVEKVENERLVSIISNRLNEILPG